MEFRIVSHVFHQNTVSRINKMADRRKVAQVTAENSTQETDKQYLEKQVHGTMKDLLAKIIENRPDDPIKFMASYFETLTLEDKASDLINRAVQTLLLTHYSRPVFETNLHSAFVILGNYKINKRLQGINGTVLSTLLQELCKSFPSVITIRLVKRLECFEFEAVTFDVFRSSIYTCFILQEYINVADKLFQLLDVHKTGKADKNLCDLMLAQLKNAQAGPKNDPKRILECGYKLSPNCLYAVLEKIVLEKQGQGCYTREQFAIEACDSFLMKVNRPK